MELVVRDVVERIEQRVEPAFVREAGKQQHRDRPALRDGDRALDGGGRRTRRREDRADLVGREGEVGCGQGEDAVRVGETREMEAQRFAGAHDDQPPVRAIGQQPAEQVAGACFGQYVLGVLEDEHRRPASRAPGGQGNREPVGDGDLVLAEHRFGLREAGGAAVVLVGQCGDHAPGEIERGRHPAAVADRAGGITAEKFAHEGRFAEARRRDDRDDRGVGDPDALGERGPAQVVRARWGGRKRRRH